MYNILCLLNRINTAINRTWIWSITILFILNFVVFFSSLHFQIYTLSCWALLFFLKLTLWLDLTLSIQYENWNHETLCHFTCYKKPFYNKNKIFNSTINQDFSNQKYSTWSFSLKSGCSSQLNWVCIYVQYSLDVTKTYT